MGMLLERGYNDLGIQAVLDEAEVPKGSFYHHFKSKEDFALQVIDLYMGEVHKGLDACLGDTTRPPLQRVRGLLRGDARELPEGGLPRLPAGGTGAGAVGGQRGVPAEDRVVHHRHRRSAGGLPGRGPARRGSAEDRRSPADGPAAGGLLGGRRAPQPPAPGSGAAAGDARLLLFLGRPALIFFGLRSRPTGLLETANRTTEPRRRPCESPSRTCP